MFGNIGAGEIILFFLIGVIVFFFIRVKTMVSRTIELRQLNKTTITETKKVIMTVPNSNFKDDILQINKLFISGIDTEGEYRKKKEDMISRLVENKITCSAEEFLVELLPLKERSILTTEEIIRIKNIIS